MSTLWKLLPSNAFLLLSKGKIVKREELINDITNKQVLNQVIKQHLTDFVIEYNIEVSEPKGHWEKGRCVSCVPG